MWTLGHQQEVPDLVDELRADGPLTGSRPCMTSPVAGEYADRMVLATRTVGWFATGTPNEVLSSSPAPLGATTAARVRVIPGDHGAIDRPRWRSRATDP
jgi:hypothetical protein